MTNEEKIKELVRDYVPTLENFDSSQVLREALTEIAEWKDEQLKLHEQSLLWCVQSVLDNLVIDQESYDIALEEFKSHLTDDFNE